MKQVAFIFILFAGFLSCGNDTKNSVNKVLPDTVSTLEKLKPLKLEKCN